MMNLSNSALRLGGLFAAYYVAALAGLFLLTQTNNIALVWPATAILMVYLLKHRPSSWYLPLLLCWGGGILANFTLVTQLPIGVMLSLTGADVFLDALVAVLLLRRFANPETLFDSVRGVTTFLLLGCVIPPAIGGLWGGGTIALAFGAPFWPEWFKWWTSTAVSVSIMAPALAIFSLAGMRAAYSGNTRLEAAGLCVVTLGVSAVIFTYDFASLLFLVIPILLWTTVRFGVFGVSVIGATLAATAITFTLADHGPVAAMHTDLVHEVGFLQLFLMANYIPALVCAVVLRQRTIAENAMRQAQKMEAIGQLTGGIAHDFNNLLSIIMGNLELVLLRREIDDRSEEELQRALNAAKRGAALTHRLLAFARQQPLMPIELEINETVRGLENLLQRTLGEEIDLNFIAGTDLWHCEVDPSQIENAVVNLAINARDAMPKGGRLTVETANAYLDDEYAAAQLNVEPGQYVMLAVSDTGTGMSEDILDHAFEPFFTTKQTGSGSGLGLSMVKGFVEQSGGYIKIYSEPGEGTSVKIYLPRTQGPKTAPHAEAQDGEVPLGSGETILLVEDDEDVRGLITTLLVGLGYRILDASSGKHALDLVGSGAEIDLLLTDVVLPGGIGGRELAESICEKLPDIGVLYMSGYTANAIIHDGRVDEGVKLLPKPFRRIDLARAVRDALDERTG